MVPLNIIYAIREIFWVIFIIKLKVRPEIGYMLNFLCPQMMHHDHESLPGLGKVCHEGQYSIL